MKRTVILTFLIITLFCSNVMAAYIPSDSWTNQNVYVEIAPATDAVSSQLKIDSGSFTTYNPSNQPLISSEGTHTVQSFSTDAAGNNSETTTRTIKIDKTNPVASAVTSSVGGFTNQSTYTVRVSGVSDGLSGIFKVAFPTWTTLAGQDDLIADWPNNAVGTNLGNGVWEYTVNAAAHNGEDGQYHTDVYVYDNAGNSPYVGSAVVTIDRGAPGAPTISTTTTWTNAASVPVTITPGADSVSGVNRIEYSLSGATTQGWTNYSGPFGVANVGQTIIQARTIDNSSNISATTSQTVSIDRVGPTATSVTSGTLTIDNFKIYADGVTDAGSGLQTVKFLVWTINGGSADQRWYPATYVGGRWEATVYKSNHGNENGAYYVECHGVDNAGNDSIMGNTTVKINQDPGAMILSPANNSSLGVSSKPSFSIKVTDLDLDTITATLEYYDGSTWQSINSITGLANNQIMNIDCPDYVWRRAEYGVDHKFRIKVFDGVSIGYSSDIALKKNSTSPTVTVNSPSNNQNMTSGYLAYDVTINDPDNEFFPIAAKDSDFLVKGNGAYVVENGVYTYNYNQNLGWTYRGYDIAVDPTKTYTYTFEAYISEDANIPATGNTFIANGESGFATAFYYDNTKKGTWQKFYYTGKPTSNTARILLYPTAATSPASQGYIKYRNVSFSSNTLDLKVSTDTANIANGGVFFDGKVGNGNIKFVSYTYMPVGQHNMSFSASDGGAPVTVARTINIPEEISLYTGNTDNTFYLAQFDLEKNQVYYNRLNTKLLDSIYFLNILGANSTANESWVSSIPGMQKVTSQNQYLQRNLVEGDGATEVGSFNGQTGTNASILNMLHPVSNQIIKVVSLNTGDASTIVSPALALKKGVSYTFEFDYWSDIDGNSFTAGLAPSTLPQENIVTNKGIQHYVNTFSSTSDDMANSFVLFTKNTDLPNGGSIYITNIRLYESEEKRTRIYATDGIKPNSIVEWILRALGTSPEFNQSVEVGTRISIQNITFRDPEKDYTTTNPNPNRGKNRRFQLIHVPGYYNNPDAEIQGNGAWIPDAAFTSFDGQPIERNGQDVSLTFTKAGKYILNVIEEDDIQNPSGVDFSKSSNLSNYTIYVHRAPIAVINYIPVNATTVKLFSQSYDLDFYQRTDRGIKSLSWEYKIVDYSDNTIQDWLPIPDINNFFLIPVFKTYVRLTVTDYGGTIAGSNDNELSGTTTKVFDNIGQPPVADFLIKVGTSLDVAVPSWGYVYRGAQTTDGQYLAETVQLDDSLIQWNDFFATSGTQSKAWSVNQVLFNWRIKTLLAADTTLTVTNKFGLSHSVAKSAQAKRVDISKNTLDTFDAETYQNFNFALTSLDGDLNWPDLEVRVNSPEMGIYNEVLENTISNIFTKDIYISPTENDNCTYTASIYSKRTGELLQRNTYSVTVNNLKITGVDIRGYWNHWRGQIDIFGKQMTVEPHRFLSLETVKVKVNTTGYADKIEIRFSPELEAMQFTDVNSKVYDYKDDFFGYYVYFPQTISLNNGIKANEVIWEYALPLANSTKSMDDVVLRAPYSMTVTAWKGSKSVTYIINDIDITSNIYDLTFIQPVD